MKKLGLGLGLLAVTLSMVACGKNTVSVELTENVGDTPIKLVKCVQEVTGLDVKDAKAIVDNAPSIVVEDVSKEEADEIKIKLEEVGGAVTIK